MSTHRKRPLGRVCLMALALAALFLLSFVWGRYDVPLGEVVRILLSRLFPLTQTWTANMAIAVHNAPTASASSTFLARPKVNRVMPSYFHFSPTYKSVYIISKERNKTYYHRNISNIILKFRAHLIGNGSYGAGKR